MAESHSPTTTSPSASVNPPSQAPASTNPSKSSSSHIRSSGSRTYTTTSSSKVSAPRRLAELRTLHLVEVESLPVLHHRTRERLLEAHNLVLFDYPTNVTHPRLRIIDSPVQVRNFLVRYHPAIVSESTHSQIALLVCCLFCRPQILDAISQNSLEISWSSNILLPIARDLATIVNDAFIDADGVAQNPDAFFETRAVPLCREQEYNAQKKQTSLLRLPVTYGTKADFAFGISKYGFRIFDRSLMVDVDVETLFGRQDDGIFLRLDENPFEMIFPFLFIEVKRYNTPREDGSQQPHKDGKPQAYQAMMSGLVLYDYTRELASTRSPNQYQRWENETSIDDREMLKRSYGVVTHQSGWYFFVMVLCTNANAGAVGGRQFQVTQIAQKDVSDVGELHRFLEIMRIALSEVFARKRMLQQLLSMLTEPTVEGRPTATRPGQLTAQASSFSVPPHPPSGNQLPPATSSRDSDQTAISGRGHDSRSIGHMPWANVDDPKRRKKLLVNWWKNGGREWSLQGPTLQETPPTPVPTACPPISPSSYNGLHSNTNIILKPQTTFDLNQHNDKTHEHPTTGIAH